MKRIDLFILGFALFGLIWEAVQGRTLVACTFALQLVILSALHTWSALRRRRLRRRSRTMMERLAHDLDPDRTWLVVGNLEKKKRK